MPGTLSGSVNVKSKLPNERAMGLRRRAPLWPYAWLALEGVATVVWVFALGWAAITFFGWLVG
jgi:hypothetical protein